MSKSLEYQRPDNDAARAIAAFRFAANDGRSGRTPRSALRTENHIFAQSFYSVNEACRDVCHYCTFAQPPRNLEEAFLSPEQVLAIAGDGAAAGCKEALFTLGDKPELRYQAARDALAEYGHETTLSYLREMALLVFEETGLLPHLNPGVLEAGDYAALREVSVSMGSMLESASPRLLQKGFCHHGSPDKNPKFGSLPWRKPVGKRSFHERDINWDRRNALERIEALLALRNLQDEYGHLQEIIIQNFRSKPDTLMANAPEPSLEDLQWTIAAARILFGPEIDPGAAEFEWR